MTYRFYNAYILTMDESDISVVGELWTKDDRIVYVGPCVEGSERARRCEETGIPAGGFDREIDCEWDVLMPGFKNAHAHSGMTALRSAADDQPLDEWLHKQIFPREAKLTAEDIAVLTKLAVMEYVSGGVTAVFDMYLTPDEIAQAFIETGMRCVQNGTVNNFTHSPEQLEDFYIRLNGLHPLMSYRLGFHAEYTTDRAILEKIAALAQKYRAPVHMHLSETEKEVNDCIGRYGMSPVAFLDSLGIFAYGGAGFHCVHVSDEDMEILRKRGVYAVTNPSSNMKLVSGIAPVVKLFRRGIGVAIGTDGPASSNGLNMFKEMYLLSVLAKLKEQDPAALSPLEILNMATVSGARVMGLTDCQYLKAGSKADLIRISLKEPEMRPLHSVDTDRKTGEMRFIPQQFAANLVYSGAKSDVCMTVVDGRILYENGQYRLGFDKEELFMQVEKIAKRLTVEAD